VAAGGTPSAAAAKAVTATIPINFAVAVDPVEAGFVASLSHPGGNLTGVTNWNVEVGPKRLEVLHQLLPTATTVAVLVDPTSPALSDAFLRGLKIAAPTFGLQLYVLQASTGPDIDMVFASLDERQPGALIIGPSTFFNTRSQQLAALSLRHSMPAIYQFRPFVAAVGLISYGSDETEFYGLVGNYAGKILKGEKPADLPVVQNYESRTDHQSQDRQDARHYRTAVFAKSRRRGDRITILFAAHVFALGPRRTSLVALHMSAFGGRADMTCCAA
jgi:putative ABC transport system substrate-binding protein